jgi:hypothetical protein
MRKSNGLTTKGTVAVPNDIARRVACTIVTGRAFITVSSSCLGFTAEAR